MIEIQYVYVRVFVRISFVQQFFVPVCNSIDMCLWQCNQLHIIHMCKACTVYSFVLVLCYVFALENDAHSIPFISPLSRSVHISSESDYNCGKRYSCVYVCMSMMEKFVHTYFWCSFFSATLYYYDKNLMCSRIWFESIQKEEKLHTDAHSFTQSKNWKEAQSGTSPGFIFVLFFVGFVLFAFQLFTIHIF